MMAKKWDAPDESVWGKSRGLSPGLPPYPLIRHLLDAAAMALHLWDAYLSENQRARIADGMGLAGELERARNVVGLCAGLHDIGKLSGFQFCSWHGSQYLSAELGDKRKEMTAYRFGHDVAGLQVVQEVLADLGFAADAELQIAERLAEIVGGHHGRYHRLDNGVAPAFLGGSAWARQRTAHAAAVHELLGAPEAPDVFKAPAAVLVTGVVILADWLVSQEDYLRGRQQRLEPALTDHFERSLKDAPGLLAGAGLARVRLQRKGFAEAYGIQGAPNPLQLSVMEELSKAVGEGRRGGIVLVTAAPGDGKSETALEAERVLSERFGTQGYAFLLPTMATSDQMYGRVAKALLRQAGENAGVTLVHSMAWLNSAYADDDLETQGVLTCDGDEVGESSLRAEADMRPRRWLCGAKRPLLAQFSVGTVDQALMAVLPVRHNALRLLALSGKTFIVDEAHAYDPYMQVLLSRLLNWAWGVRCPGRSIAGDVARVCQRSADQGVSVEAPPRRRGGRPEPGAHGRADRNTPASAGRTCTAPCRPRPRTDHPRVEAGRMPARRLQPGQGTDHPRVAGRTRTRGSAPFCSRTSRPAGYPRCAERVQPAAIVLKREVTDPWGPSPLAQMSQLTSSLIRARITALTTTREASRRTLRRRANLCRNRDTVSPERRQSRGCATSLERVVRSSRRCRCLVSQ
ncbi:CRISPR-associated endonuclease Cas3'' [Streptomyces achromogenes]|uniref:CRISPR-associated endonuclease Cas3'' n=1 Tax=Streptomyces achromogenes TaxID=67255 RepID=UPI003701E1B6